jgi:phosphoglycolate phosphatase
MSRCAAIFDLDGTLTDSKEGILRCLIKTLQQFSVPFEGPLEWFIGPPPEVSLNRLLPQADDASKHLFLEAYRKCYADGGWKENSVYAGVPEMLESLREDGWELYLCTSKLERLAVQVLSYFELSNYFHGIAAYRPEKPLSKTELLEAILLRYDLHGQLAVMIGDTKYDILAAKKLCIPSVGVTYGYGKREELSDSGSDYLCDGPLQAVSALKSIRRRAEAG